MSNLPLSTINKIEKSIRNAKNFQYITSNKSTEIIDALRQISIRSGLAVYIWSSEQGMVNIKSRQTPLPATRQLLGALKYAAKNHYFAVYVFPGLTNKDLLEIKSTLPKAGIFLKTNDTTKLLFLINENTPFNFLESNGDKIDLFNKHTKKYKLRDNQWVLSNG